MKFKNKSCERVFNKLLKVEEDLKNIKRDIRASGEFPTYTLDMGKIEEDLSKVLKSLEEIGGEK